MKSNRFCFIVKQLRTKSKKTTAEVSRDLNIPEALLKEYESGKEQPPISFLLTLAQYYEVTLDYLMTGEDFPSKNA